MSLFSRLIAVTFTVGLFAINYAYSTDQATANPLFATVETGRLEGVLNNGVIVFKGIHYAAPPIGPLRWRPPQPVHAWNGIHPAQNFGHDCMQLPLGNLGSGLAPDEDCLTLNVWRPANKAAKNLPVMVWITGGGNVNLNSASPVYDGTQFASQDVILVSFNYRVGRFGFFAHPALRTEYEHEMKGNYGLMDQLAALKWVKKNIGAFDGDANNITVFGESAGGFGIHVLMTSQKAKGLFRQAISMSGGGRTGFVPGRHLDHTGPEGLPSAEQVGKTFAHTVGIQGEDKSALAQLRALPAESIVGNLNMATLAQNFTTFSNTMIDGKLVVDEPGTVYKAGNFQKVPLIIGATDRDLAFPTATSMEQALALFDPGYRQTAREVYDPRNTGNFMAVATQISSDQLMVEPSRFVANTLSAQGASVYQYRFSYVASSIRDTISGAQHASELPYVFDTLKAKYGAAVSKEDQEMAHLVNRYWISFAKTGSPNNSRLPKWPPYSTNTLLDLSAKGAEQTASRTDPWKARLDLIERVNSK
ncbi:carboxylesterase family protein [Pseudomonas sp. MAFF 212408]|uniref:Carboxylesterase family protein n=1 Tax=Pseudomonas kitaguniensis TaxID=2607908 RepID=A0A5N7KGD4_9PSED|nr:carboxylesterase family protein [Pseudomonas kitaguniensis]MPR00745.1 carboxylesterase family protein [Pseudomonas kitaguniensis]